MASKYVIGEVSAAMDSRKIETLLNRAAGDGWELVEVVLNTSRGMLQHYLRSETGRSAEDVVTMFMRAENL
jgi:hypothetical protein